MSNLLLQKNIKKFKILFIMGILSFFGCSSKEVNKPVYKYNTEEYNQKIKEFDVSIDKAIEIAANSLNDKEEKTQELTLDIVYGDFYIFKPSEILYNHKTGHYSLSGIWINGKTGDMIEKDTEKYVKVTLKIPFTDSTRYNRAVNK